MTNRVALKRRLLDADTNISGLAREIGMSKSNLYSKISGNRDFTCREVGRITEALHLSASDVSEIFFATEVE